MSDNEISIIIRAAVDEAIKNLQLVNKNLGDLNKTTIDSSKQQEQTTKSFKSNTEALLAMGNIANSVDNILSSHMNLQLRIENAEDRVMTSREALNKLTKEGKQGTLEYENAQRRLEISENNLQRANNMVIGSYIGMGIQVLNLTTSIPKAIEGIQGMIAVTKGLNDTTKSFLVTAAPYVIILSVVAFAVSQLIPILDNKKVSIDNATTSIKNNESALNSLSSTTITSAIPAVQEHTKEIGNLYTNLMLLIAANKELKSIKEEYGNEEEKKSTIEKILSLHAPGIKESGFDAYNRMLREEAEARLRLADIFREHISLLDITRDKTTEQVLLYQQMNDINTPVNERLSAFILLNRENLNTYNLASQAILKADYDLKNNNITQQQHSLTIAENTVKQKEAEEALKKVAEQTNLVIGVDVYLADTLRGLKDAADAAQKSLDIVIDRMLKMGGKGAPGFTGQVSGHNELIIVGPAGQSHQEEIFVPVDMSVIDAARLIYPRGTIVDGVTLAKGGIITEPTFALMGERGPEAVIPLNKLGDKFGINVYIENIYGVDANDIAMALQEKLINQIRT